jgi:hypothetical protein
LLTHRTAIGATVRGRKGDFVFLFKVPTSPEGSVFTDEIKNFNGFGEAFSRGAGEDFDNGYKVSFASGIFDKKAGLGSEYTSRILY